MRGSPSLAALLSFVWPGLGQLYVGRRRAALLFALPAVAVTLLVLFQARQGLTVLAARFVDPGYALAACILIILVGAWRAVAVLHAYSTGERVRVRRSPELGALSALLILILATHSLGAYVAFADYSTFSEIFGGSDLPGVDQTPEASLDPGATPGPSTSPTPIVTMAPQITPSPEGRVTILLTGLDQYAGRSERLYDSIMVVSVDRKSGKVAMVSVPRDSIKWPLYFNPKVLSSVKINALVTYAQHGWIQSPDDPYTTLIKEISYLVGVPINYYAILDLAGFMKLVDMVGGIDIDNPYLISDPVYDWLDGVHHGFTLTPGKHHLDGKNALAYVRSRHGSYNNDYMRASRQQQVLVAIERKMASPDMMLRFPEFMATASKTIRTNFPAGQVADLVALGESIPKESITQVVLAPSTYMTANCLRLDHIAVLSVKLFGEDSRYYGKTQANVC